MDKPTTPNPADLGLKVPGTEESKQAEEAIEALRKAEEADPALKRKHQRENADLQKAYHRFGGRDPSDAWRQEELIRDARKYAESYLGEAQSPEARLIVTRRIWSEFIPNHPNRGAFQLYFDYETAERVVASLHTAIWTEGNPSLEERAKRAAEGGFPKEKLVGDMKPGGAEPAQRPTPNADQVVPAQPGGKVGAPWDNVEICFLDADHAQVTVLGQVRSEEH